MTTIDTYLAQVVGVANAVFDAAGHLVTPATLYLNVYDQANGASSLNRLTNGAVNYTYTAGSWILLNGVSSSYSNDKLSNNGGSVQYGASYYNLMDNAEIVGAASSVVGAQSYVYSDNSRTVAGTKHATNVQFNHDATSGNVGITNYTWFIDSYGNLIGSFAIAPTYSYAVIRDIQWINPVGAAGYAQATLRYVDGTTTSVKVSGLNGYGLTYQTASHDVGNVVNGDLVVSTSLAENVAFYAGTALYAVSDLGDGTVSLAHVGTRTSGNVTSGVSLVGSANIPTNSNTTFVVRTTDVYGNYVYTNYAGYNTVPSITSASIIDYVLGVDNYAKYVYIVGDPNAAVSASLVHVKNLTWFYDNNSRNYVLTDAYVNGVRTDVRVADINDYAANTVYEVVYTNNVVADGANTAITGSPEQLGSTTNYAKLVTVSSINADVLYDGSTHWNVTTATTYDGTATVGSTVVVVYTYSTTTVSAIYVIA